MAKTDTKPREQPDPNEGGSDPRVVIIPRRDEDGDTSWPYLILDKLVAAHHHHLHDARIALAWHYGWRADQDGRIQLGKARKARELEYRLHGYDFVIELNHEAWNTAEFTEAQCFALIDHELCHCSVSTDPEGTRKTDKRTGRPAWRIRKHDVEEFQEVVARHGTWKRDVEDMVRAAMDREPNLFDGDGTDGEDPEEDGDEESGG